MQATVLFFSFLFLLHLSSSETCPENESYSDCGNLCAPTCSQPDRPLYCKMKCQPGCFCNEGFVRNDEGICVQLEECSTHTSSHDIVKRAAGHHHWNYEEDAGPIHWPHNFKTCGGRRQSPINIDPPDVDFNDLLNDFYFLNYEAPLVDATIKNNGHTIQISPSDKDPPRIIGDGGLDDRYRFLQAHFHWGSDSKKGSEHTVDGKQYPLELHLVHINENYGSVEKALRKEDGLAVLGILFKVDSEDNPDLEPIISKLNDVRSENTETKLGRFPLASLLPGSTMPYYRYEGSLTTPGCHEVVTWTVFTEFLPISEKQLQEFRKVKEIDEGQPEESLVDNFRPPQPLNTRIVEISGTSAAERNSAPSFGETVVSVLSFFSFLL